MDSLPIAHTLPGVTHWKAEVNGTRLHWTSAGQHGSPILLIHGFPGSWWSFHKVMPLLSKSHQVFAVDLRGCGDSDTEADEHSSVACAEDLHQLIAQLGLGPVHLVAQGISGSAVFRLATSHPQDLLSLTAIDMGLPGFGLEDSADITTGGAWHIGLLASAGVPEIMLTGRERDFLMHVAFPSQRRNPDAVCEEDIEEFVRTYSRVNGWRGTVGLFRSMLSEGREIKALAELKGVSIPVLALGAGEGSLSHNTMTRCGLKNFSSVQLTGVGHHAALEAPDRVAAAILEFTRSVEPNAYFEPTSTLAPHWD